MLRHLLDIANLPPRPLAGLALWLAACATAPASDLPAERRAAVERTFLELVREGQAALERVVTEPEAGFEHLDRGAPHDYGEPFPTSGPHDPRATEPGFYREPQPPTRLVHALEHGNIVVYYDQPGFQALSTLRSWTRLYHGHWDGLVVVPMQGLGQRLMLTAWRHRLELERFEPAAAAAFIDAFRGRGPERPVR